VHEESRVAASYLRSPNRIWTRFSRCKDSPAASSLREKIHTASVLFSEKNAILCLVRT
jgi:hypothetical protein